MPRMLRRLPWSWRWRWRRVVFLENAHALRAQLGLRGEERLHAPERGVRLLPHQLTPHQSLQLHYPSQRAQSRPRHIASEGCLDSDRRRVLGEARRQVRPARGQPCHRGRGVRGGHRGVGGCRGRHRNRHGVLLLVQLDVRRRQPKSLIRQAAAPRRRCLGTFPRRHRPPEAPPLLLSGPRRRQRHHRHCLGLRPVLLP
uniref:Uncharacterized protein n=1 Tax=Arundo donax TaxID=35708 RepID=A0A0A9CWL5_ARUDO